MIIFLQHIAVQVLGTHNVPLTKRWTSGEDSPRASYTFELNLRYTGAVPFSILCGYLALGTLSHRKPVQLNHVVSSPGARYQRAARFCIRYKRCAREKSLELGPRSCIRNVCASSFKNRANFLRMWKTLYNWSLSWYEDSFSRVVWVKTQQIMIYCDSINSRGNAQSMFTALKDEQQTQTRVHTHAHNKT